MARTVGRLLCTIWNDPDWRALTKDAQRLYMLLLGQGRLSLAGCIDLMPGRWAALADDDTVDDLNRALLELADRRFVAVDWDTSELVIRTLAKHDVGNGTLNKNLIKGFWSAWLAILSHELRRVVIENTPAPLWDKNPDDVPHEAQQIRRSSRLEPTSQPSVATTVETTVPTPGTNPPTTSTSTSTSSTAAATDHTSRPNQPDDDDLDRARRTEARRRTTAEVTRHQGTNRQVTSPAALERTIHRNLITEGWTPPTNGTTLDAHRPAPEVIAKALPDSAELAAVDTHAGLATARAALTNRETTDT